MWKMIWMVRYHTQTNTQSEDIQVWLVWKKGLHTDMYLQAVRQLYDWLLKEKGHEHEVDLWGIGVFGQ